MCYWQCCGNCYFWGSIFLFIFSSSADCTVLSLCFEKFKLCLFHILYNVYLEIPVPINAMLFSSLYIEFLLKTEKKLVLPPSQCVCTQQISKIKLQHYTCSASPWELSFRFYIVSWQYFFWLGYIS